MRPQVRNFERFTTIVVLIILSLKWISVKAENWPRKNVELGWNYSTFEQDDLQKLKSGISFKFDTSRTFYLTKSSNIFRLGLDVVWCAMSFTKYDVEFRQEPHAWKDNLLNFNLGPQLGLNFTLQPTQSLFVVPYVRYSPTFQIYHDENENITSFSWGGLIGGVKIIYKFIGLGIDYQMNSLNMKPLYQEYYLQTEKDKVKTNNYGLRTYILINF